MEAVTEAARRLVLRAIDSGWAGPPFDPIALADLLGIRVEGTTGIPEARTVPDVGQAGVRIEYNPTRPPARVRYSLAHELAHTLFPDCASEVRHRLAREEMRQDDWQLEMLCNVAAAEILMPAGTMPHLRGDELTIDRLLELRRRYEVSAEALLIRAARLADEPCAAFCATRLEQGKDLGAYRVDYAIPSPKWGGPAPRPDGPLEKSAVGACTAIGFTAKGEESWAGVGKVYVEAVGIPSYPGHAFPRVVGILRAEGHDRPRSPVRYLQGDATQPAGPGERLIAHVVNDRTPRWGGRGFASALRRRFPEVQGEFLDWAEGGEDRLRLGRVHVAELGGGIGVAHMVAQQGYGPSTRPRIRYAALRDCLIQVAEIAAQRGAGVHMPRIGTGEAGGRWDVVEELVLDTLVAGGVTVTVYDLPGGKGKESQITFDLTQN